MVGVFSRFSYYVLLKPLQPQEKKLKGQEEEEEEEEVSDVMSCSSPVDNSINSTDEEELALLVRVDAEEFLPIEHPVEPIDDDRPAKCPLSDYSFDNDADDETFAESLRKRLQSSSAADGEKYQISSTRRDAAAAASSRGSQYNIFHIFQQCKENME